MSLRVRATAVGGTSLALTARYLHTPAFPIRFLKDRLPLPARHQSGWLIEGISITPPSRGVEVYPDSVSGEGVIV